MEDVMSVVNIEFEDDTVFTESSIVSEKFEIEESICDYSELKFGGCESTCVNFHVIDPIRFKDKTGMKFYLYYQGKARGIFKVDKIELSDDRRTAKITAYDELYSKLDTDITDWYNSYVGTQELNHVLWEDLLGNVLNIQYDDSIFMGIDGFENGLGLSENTKVNAKQFINDMAEANGRFFYYDPLQNKGFFKQLKYDALTASQYPSENKFPANYNYPYGFKDIPMSKYISFSYNDEINSAYDGILIKGNLSNATYEISGEKRKYTINNNIVVNNYDSIMLKGIAEVWVGEVQNTRYKSIKNLKMIHDSDVKLGDVIRVYLESGYIDSLVLHKITTGIYNPIDTIISN